MLIQNNGACRSVVSAKKNVHGRVMNVGTEGANQKKEIKGECEL